MGCLKRFKMRLKQRKGSEVRLGLDGLDHKKNRHLAVFC